MLDECFFEIAEDEKMPRQQYLNLYKCVGAAMEVYNNLGRGMEEAIYQEALEIELKSQNIPFAPQQPLRTWYKGVLMNKIYYADIVAFNNIILELKSTEKIGREHRAQLFNYLRITKNKCGALINYSDTSFYCERYWYVESLDEFMLLKKDNLSVYVQE